MEMISYSHPRYSHMTTSPLQSKLSPLTFDTPPATTNHSQRPKSPLHVLDQLYLTDYPLLSNLKQLLVYLQLSHFDDSHQSNQELQNNQDDQSNQELQNNQDDGNNAHRQILNSQGLQAAPPTRELYQKILLAKKLELLKQLVVSVVNTLEKENNCDNPAYINLHNIDLHMTTIKDPDTSTTYTLPLVPEFHNDPHNTHEEYRPPELRKDTILAILEQRHHHSHYNVPNFEYTVGDQHNAPSSEQQVSSAKRMVNAEKANAWALGIIMFCCLFDLSSSPFQSTKNIIEFYSKQLTTYSSNQKQQKNLSPAPDEHSLTHQKSIDDFTLWYMKCYEQQSTSFTTEYMQHHNIDKEKLIRTISKRLSQEERDIIQFDILLQLIDQCLSPQPQKRPSLSNIRQIIQKAL